ncbi:MAG: hypothetical protein J5I92_14820 [Thiogranum sp.]|nr:hypothetical protein [Thiogranum sp.]
MLAVAEFANQSGTVRYNTRIGLLQPERRLDNARPLYKRRDIKRLIESFDDALGETGSGGAERP